MPNNTNVLNRKTETKRNNQLISQRENPPLLPPTKIKTNTNIQIKQQPKKKEQLKQTNIPT